MAAKTGIWRKIIKGVMIGGGTILSLLPGGAAIGVPLITAGVAMKTDTPIISQGTADVIGQSVNTLNDVFNASKAQTTAGNVSLWISANKWVYFVGGGLILLITIMLMGRRRRK